VREASYALNVKLTRRVAIGQFDQLPVDVARDCVDCIGHSWDYHQRRVQHWHYKVDETKGLASGTSADVESGFAAASLRQHKPIARNMLAKVREIEIKLAHGEKAVVACNHGSNRSFLIVNLYMQKTYDISYEQVRQLMTSHRGVADGPLTHERMLDEPKEQLRSEFCHRTRVPVPLTTRFNHHRRWHPVGLEYVDLVATSCTAASMQKTITYTWQTTRCTRMSGHAASENATMTAKTACKHTRAPQE